MLNTYWENSRDLCWKDAIFKAYPFKFLVCPHTWLDLCLSTFQQNIFIRPILETFLTLINYHWSWVRAKKIESTEVSECHLPFYHQRLYPVQQRKKLNTSLGKWGVAGQSWALTNVTACGSQLQWQSLFHVPFLHIQYIHVVYWSNSRNSTIFGQSFTCLVAISK